MTDIGILDRIPAYLDDVANYIPARLAGLSDGRWHLSWFRLDGAHALADFSERPLQSCQSRILPRRRQ